MHTAHAIVAHSVLIPVVVAALVGAVLAALRLDRREQRGQRLGDPLDLELVRRWNAQTH